MNSTILRGLAVGQQAAMYSSKTNWQKSPNDKKDRDATGLAQIMTIGGGAGDE